MNERINELKPVFVKHIPPELESGILYVSEEYECVIHLCACGCGGKTVTPFNCIIDGHDHGWKYTRTPDDKITLRPSIGNFMGENPYHAHYYITENKIQWL